MSDHQHCINCLEEVEGSYLYPCVQCGWSPDQYSETGLYLSPGTILNNQYQIGKMLGHGGFGITYLAWDTLLHRRLAIKEYMPRDFATRNATNSTISIYAGAATESFAYGLERFLDEARTLAKFQQHAGIVSVLNVFYGNSTGYMVMEYVEGRTLKDYLLEKGLLSWELTLQLFMPIMDALREVHKGGIMHRDISPDNIYLCNDNRIKLLDFGSARYALGGHSLSLSVVVKPGYAPEEQYRAKGKQGPWTDVYSVAASMYRCICGEVPPDALDRLDEDELVAPSNLGIQISQKSEAALISALAIKANDRTQSIEAFQQAIWNETTNNEPVAVIPQARRVVPPVSSQEEPITIDLTDNAASDEDLLTASVISVSQSKKSKIELIAILFICILFFGYFAIFVPRSGSSELEQAIAVEKSKVGKNVISQSKQSKMDQAVALYNANDYNNAIKEFNTIAISKESTEEELKVSLNYLGFIYYKGLGVSQNYPQAFANFTKAAELGEAFSQNLLGEMYFSGYGVTKSNKLAFKWYQKAAGQGNIDGQSSLAMMYFEGFGTSKNNDLAFFWLKKAADQGRASEQNGLGLFYNQGIGVTQDNIKAFEWYQKAAEQGLANGQFNLGLLYENGWGIQQNKDEAIKWYRLAAEQGNAEATSALKKLGVK